MDDFPSTSYKQLRHKFGKIERNTNGFEDGNDEALDLNEPQMTGPLSARAISDFSAVRSRQLSLVENETVMILSVSNGYAKCQKMNGEIGDVPSYFLEMVECPGTTFADQIHYRRKWYAVVDEIKFIDSYPSNPDVFVWELGHAPQLSTFAQILPHQHPQISSKDAPFVTMEFADATVRVGDVVTMECQIFSNHKYCASWNAPDTSNLTGSKSDSAVESNIFFTKDAELPGHFLLTIAEIQASQSGQYSLIANNKYGKCSTSATITVIEAPSPPIDLCMDMAAVSEKNTIKLIWNPPLFKGGTKSIWYTVEYRKDDLSQFFDVITGVSDCEIHIAHLQPNVDYFFRVYAYNNAFRSKPTNELHINLYKFCI